MYTLKSIMSDFKEVAFFPYIKLPEFIHFL